MGLLLLLALLLFGRRLPEVGKALGKSIVEFKKGVKGIEDEINDASHEVDRAAVRPPLTAAGTDERVTFQEPETTSEPVEAHNADESHA